MLMRSDDGARPKSFKHSDTSEEIPSLVQRSRATPRETRTLIQTLEELGPMRGFEKEDHP